MPLAARYGRLDETLGGPEGDGQLLATDLLADIQVTVGIDLI